MNESPLPLARRLLPRDVKYCRGCWRDEWHTPVRANPITTVLLVAVTLGAGLYLWPYQCVTCKRVRPRLAWGKGRSDQQPA